MVDDPAPFRDYHRSKAWMLLARRSSIVAGAAAILGALSLLVAAAPAPAEPPLIAPPAAAAVAELAPVEVVASAPLADTAAPPVAAPASWSIDIDTVGYQAEVDACLWVRMDLGAVAPIVAAHNYCGGGVVLQMAIGDVVELRGTSLDGSYTVVESRDAHAGDHADAATSGMTADVILQTCYWHSGGKERLLGLVRARQ